MSGVLNLLITLSAQTPKTTYSPKLKYTAGTRAFREGSGHLDICEARIGSITCQFRLKIPHCTGRKFPTPNLHRRASLASDGVEPSAVFWRVLGGTESEAKERAAASAPSCPRGGTRPALRRSFSR